MSQWDHKPGLGQTAADDIGLMAGEVGQAATRLALQLPYRLSTDRHIQWRSQVAKDPSP